MKTASDSNPPVLAPPGAGLPFYELWIARWRFGRVRRRLSPAEHSALFADERARILDLVKSCDAATGVRPVLIERLRGMEDSSRFWSVFMTLDHLRIVNDSLAGVMNALKAGKVPPGKASTADVKPAADADASAITRFDESCDRFLAAAAKPARSPEPLRYAHPWFGPLEADGWHALGGFHLRLHRGQLERILHALAT